MLSLEYQYVCILHTLSSFCIGFVQVTTPAQSIDHPPTHIPDSRTYIHPPNLVGTFTPTVVPPRVPITAANGEAGSIFTHPPRP